MSYSRYRDGNDASSHVANDPHPAAEALITPPVLNSNLTQSPTAIIDKLTNISILRFVTYVLCYKALLCINKIKRAFILIQALF